MKINSKFLLFVCLGFCLCSSFISTSNNSVQVKAVTRTKYFNLGESNYSYEQDEKVVLAYVYNGEGESKTATLTLSELSYTVSPTSTDAYSIFYIEPTLDKLSILLQGQNDITATTNKVEDITLEVFNFSAKVVEIKRVATDITTSKSLDITFNLSNTTTESSITTYSAFYNRYGETNTFNISDSAVVNILVNANIGRKNTMFMGLGFSASSTLSIQGSGCLSFKYYGENTSDESIVMGIYVGTNNLEVDIEEGNLYMDISSECGNTTIKGIYSVGDLTIKASDQANVEVGCSKGILTPTLTPIWFHALGSITYICNSNSFTHIFNVESSSISCRTLFQAGVIEDKPDIVLQFNGGIFIAKTLGEDGGIFSSTNDYSITTTDGTNVCPRFYQSASSGVGDNGSYIASSDFPVSSTTKMLFILVVPIKVDGFCSDFLNTYTNMCKVDGSTDVDKLGFAWALANGLFDAVNIFCDIDCFQSVAPFSTGSDIAKVNARYDYIYTKYHAAHTEITDFLSRSALMGNVAVGNYIRTYDSTSLITIISISSIVLLISGAWFMYHRKRKMSK